MPKFDSQTSFSMWGSALPIAPIYLAYPNWGIALGSIGNSFYIGAGGLLLAVISLFSEKTKLEKIHWTLFFIFLILSFGKWTPVLPIIYWLCSFNETLRKLSCSIRHPSSFLFFCTVSLAIIAACSFDKLIKCGAKNDTRRLDERG